MEPADPRAGDFKSADAASYDAHAEDFERFTRVLTAPLAARLVSMARLAAGHRVLDVGTGTGVVASEAARAAGPGGTVVGIDLSEKMLDLARASTLRANLADRLTFEVMDAESLRFDAARFDAVVSLFALLHFPRPALALDEMFRVLRPGGTIAIGVGSAPPLASWQGLAHLPGAVRNVAARLRGRQLAAPRFLDRLVEEWLPAPAVPEEAALAHGGGNRTRAVQRLLRAAGFENLGTHWEGHQAVLETPADFWDIQRTFSSVARKRLKGASPEQVARVRARFDEGCRDVLARGGRLIYPFAAFFVSASRR